MKSACRLTFASIVIDRDAAGGHLAGLLSVRDILECDAVREGVAGLES